MYRYKREPVDRREIDPPVNARKTLRPLNPVSLTNEKFGLFFGVGGVKYL